MINATNPIPEDFITLSYVLSAWLSTRVFNPWGLCFLSLKLLNSGLLIGDHYFEQAPR